MTTMTDDRLAAKEEFSDDLQPYRAISRSAIVAAILGVFSLLGLAFSSLLLLAIVGIVLGLTALSTIRRYPNEYTGTRLAIFGIVLSAVTFVGGSALHTYVYLTEMPDWAKVRLTFAELQPDKDHPELPISPEAVELSGEDVFIKGYMHPGVASMGKVKHFILVPDMGTCCFGGQPKMTDMIEVAIVGDARPIAYSTRTVKLAGKFSVNPYGQPRLGLNNVCYQLEARYVK